jgi:hypothetical protein
MSARLPVESLAAGLVDGDPVKTKNSGDHITLNTSCQIGGADTTCLSPSIASCCVIPPYLRFGSARHQDLSLSGANVTVRRIAGLPGCRDRDGSIEDVSCHQ